MIIRDITDIITKERIQNEHKYLELMTGTVSHEMFTPLNSIINVSKHVDN